MGPRAIITTDLEAAEHGEAARMPWLRIGFWSALVMAAYWSAIPPLVHEWWTNPDMAHGLFAAVVAMGAIWTKRLQLSGLRPKPSPFGLVLILWGAVQFYVGTLSASAFLPRTALLL